MQSLKKIGLIIPSVISILAFATPTSTHLFSPDDVIKRIDKVSSLDFGRRVAKTPFANILTEPMIRILWAGQIVTDSDWIGIQALTATSQRIDTGGDDDASNMFVYTCKGGWVDMGHVINSALGYKAIYQGLKGNSLIRDVAKDFFPPDDKKLFLKVSERIKPVFKKMKKVSPFPFNEAEFYQLMKESVQLRHNNYYKLTNQTVSSSQAEARVNSEARAMIDYLNKNYREGKNFDDLYYGFWSGYFAMQFGYAIEFNQNKQKIEIPKANWKGFQTSAWTLEDLPSDYYGVFLGATLREKAFVGSVTKQIKLEVSDLLKSLGGVDLDNDTKIEGCEDTAKENLVNDNKHYVAIAESHYVSHQEKDSDNSINPYNYTINPKKTISHACVCDESNNPINRNPKIKMQPEEISKPAQKKRIRYRGAPHKRH